MAELFWVAGDDRKKLSGFIASFGAPTYSYLEYRLGSRGLGEEYLPVWIVGAPSSEQWEKALEIRLFWADCCALILTEPERIRYSIIADSKVSLSYFGEGNSRSTPLLRNPTPRPIAARQDWERFVPKPEMLPCQVVEYYHPSQPQAPFAWRLTFMS